MDDDDSNSSRSRCSSSGVVRMLCGRTGLLCVMAAYTFLGAVLFTVLEGSSNAKEGNYPTGEPGHVRKSREECLKELWTITERLNVLYEKNWTKLVTEQLRRFERSVMESGQAYGVDDGNAGEAKWNFGGALLYSVTLLTTVGYGRLSPKTAAGKAAAMIYAAIGVPLMLILLSGFGALLAGGARRIYSKLCCVSRREKAAPTGYQRAPTSPGHRNDSGFDSGAIQLAPTYSNHVDELPAPKKPSLATVRASHARGRCRQMQMLRSCELEDADDMDMEDRAGVHSTPSRVPLIWRSPSNHPHHHHHHSHSVPEDSSVECLQQDDQPPVVPPSVILLFLAGYVCLGAAAFASSSSSWSFLDAAYFCFIALSTIGIIPNHSPEMTSQLQLFACCIYLVLGLVLVAMCFTLLQEEITYKCRQFALNIGLVKH